jgi:hypothetical protein
MNVRPKGWFAKDNQQADAGQECSSTFRRPRQRRKARQRQQRVQQA